MRPLRDFDRIASPLVLLCALTLSIIEMRRPLRVRTLPRAARLPENARLATASACVVRCAVVPILARSPRGPLRRRECSPRRDRTGARPARGRQDPEWVSRFLRQPIPGWARALLAIAALDASTYLWHRMNHQLSALWRFHEVHHRDPDLDTSTAFRFHPGEMAMSIGFRLAQQALLRPGPQLALLHEALTYAAAALHHADLDLGARVDRELARVIVTPRMHGIHHSRDPAHQNANWGVIFSVWDRVLRTLRLDVAQSTITIGPAPR